MSTEVSPLRCLKIIEGITLAVGFGGVDEKLFDKLMGDIYMLAHLGTTELHSCCKNRRFESEVLKIEQELIKERILNPWNEAEKEEEDGKSDF